VRVVRWLGRVVGGVVQGGGRRVGGWGPRQVGYGPGGRPSEENMYTIAVLGAAFPNGEVVHAADYDEVISSGQGHNGRAGLIDFIARKPA